MQYSSSQQNQASNAGLSVQQQGKSLWIGDVEPWMSENDIAKQFDNIATVTNVKLIRDKDKGNPVGYGFVEFNDAHIAKEVFQTLKG